MILPPAKLISALSFLVLPLFSHAQDIKNGISENGRILFSNTTVSIVDLLVAAGSNKTKDSIVQATNCRIKTFVDTENNINNLVITTLGPANVNRDSSGRIIIHKSIYILQSEILKVNDGAIGRSLTFRDFHFRKPLLLQSIGPSGDMDILLSNCDINSFVIWAPGVKINSIEITKSALHDQCYINIDSFESLEITNCKLYAINRNPKIRFASDEKKDSRKYLKSLGYFLINPHLDTLAYGRRNLLLPRLRLLTTSGTEFGFTDNTVEYDSLHRISFYLGKVQFLDITRNIFDSDLMLNGISVERFFDLTSNKFEKHNTICFSDFGFPPNGAKLYWEDISRNPKGYMANYKLDLDYFFSILYKGFTDEELANTAFYHQLMKEYEQLLTTFRTNGDIESSNGCFSEMKDLEGRHLSYLYRKNGGFDNYFRWKLNRLMKFYTEHGTDPAKAIVISIWIIFLFGIFYFFFPSDWDIVSKSKMLRNFRDFIQKNEEGYIRPFFSLLFTFIISLINAVTLSLNSFTTLGFGNIPTHGLARYVCIIEGFIGWFLLSIFTVALINQVLA